MFSKHSQRPGVSKAVEPIGPGDCEMLMMRRLDGRAPGKNKQRKWGDMISTCCRLVVSKHIDVTDVHFPK
jgi:hypothetical protein